MARHSSENNQGRSQNSRRTHSKADDSPQRKSRERKTRRQRKREAADNQSYTRVGYAEFASPAEVSSAFPTMKNARLHPKEDTSPDTSMPPIDMPVQLAPTVRPRRLRSTPVLRDMVAQTRMSTGQLILPAFVRDGISEPIEISSMPGVYHHSLDSIKQLAADAVEAGIGALDLFGIPTDDDKDAEGSQAWDEHGILNRAIQAVRSEVGDDLVVCADTCLDEFTDHGHCGVVRDDGVVDNDSTVSLYCQMAVAQAQAGVHMVSPSGMMDGQVAAIRESLDYAGFDEVAIMAYSAKYASAFFGPFREAVNSSLKGDRATYQQDPRNRREGVYEALLDESEGADIVMVKPAGYYLDVISEVAQTSELPVAAYQVSGEYSMIEAAAAQGWLDRRRTVLESVYSIVRAGADIVLTYWALDIAAWLREEGGIGGPIGVRRSRH